LAAAGVSAQGWTDPTATPPGANASAPLNVSSTSQVKSGGISIGSLSVTGGAVIDGGLSISSLNALRMTGGTYGSIWRNSGSNTFLLLTASGDQNGAYNAIRPFTVNNATGDVAMGENVTVGGSMCLGGVCKSAWPAAGTAITSKTCADDQYVTAVSSSGTVTCGALDSSYVQRRVSSSCPSGQAIRAISSSGTVTCVTVPSEATLTSSPISCYNNSIGSDYCSATCPSGFTISSWDCSAGVESISGNKGTCSAGAYEKGSGICKR